MNERENALKVWNHEVPEWVPMLNVCSQMIITPEINDRPLFRNGKDWFGLEWALGENTALMTHVVPDQHILTDISEWRKQVAFPSCKDLPWEQMAMRTNALWQNREATMGYVVFNMGGFERINALMGFEAGFYAMHDDIEAYTDFINAYGDYRIEQFNYIAKYLRPDFFMLHDDWGNQNNLFMNPEIWRDVFKPVEKRMVDHVHSLGIKYMHHSCGKIDQIIGDMVEIGIDSWHSVQPSNDLEYIKKTYGDKLIFAGGVDPQVTDIIGATEAEIRAEVRRSIDMLGSYGGFLCSSAVMFSTVPGVDAIIDDEGTKYGSNFYKK